MSVTLISFSFMKASPDADMAEPCTVYVSIEADSVISAFSASDSATTVSVELSFSIASVLPSSALGFAAPVQPIRSVAQSIAVIICTVFIFIVFASDLGP